MEKISLPFFYEVGASLGPLAKLSPDPNNRIPIYLASFQVHRYVYTLLTSFASLAVCRGKAIQLINAIIEAQKWMNQREPDRWKETDHNADVSFQNVVNNAKDFETILSAELQTLASYHVTQKGAYSTPDLIERAELTLTESVRTKLSSQIIGEIRQSGRCLAFDNPTASGFHIMRAVEAVMHQYYIAVCKPNPCPTHLENWGAYIKELQKSSDPVVRETVAVLQQIKDNDRNLIMHPERVLSPDDALRLFEISKGAIMAMATRLPQPKATRAKKEKTR